MEGEAAMGALTGLIEHMDWMSMLLFLMSGAALCFRMTSLSDTGSGSFQSLVARGPQHPFCW